MGRSRGPTMKLWDGVRMRRCLAAADADATLRAVTLPAAWDEAAATGLAALTPDHAAVELATLAESWLSVVADRGGLTLARDLHALLLAQQAAPAPAAWTGRESLSGMRLNLGGFAPGDTARLLDAAEAAMFACAVLWPGEPARIGLTGLAGHVAAHGLDYDTPLAREMAVALLRALRRRLADAVLVVDPPDAVDALLGVETAGIAPPFGLLDEAGALSRTTLTLLAARGTSPSAALAGVLGGREVLPLAPPTAHAAMLAALTPMLDAWTEPRTDLPAPAAAGHRRELPARRAGIAHKASVGGQKVYLRTGEYADGRPGEVMISLPQASAPVRALADCLSHAIGIGLQHGAPLADYIEALAGTRFGPAGPVDGDPEVPRASSTLDYAVRRLAKTYAPGLALPPVEADADEPPMLPLDLPRDAAPRRRGLRVVK